MPSASSGQIRQAVTSFLQCLFIRHFFSRVLVKFTLSNLPSKQLLYYLSKYKLEVFIGQQRVEKSIKFLKTAY